MAPRRTSLRSRLSLSYAAIALVTAALIGGLLVLQLDRRFSAVDEDLLSSVADRVVASVSVPGADVRRAVLSTAYTMNARVELLDGQGQVLADSGSPWTVDPGEVGQQTAVNRPSDREVRSDAVVVRQVPGGTAPEGVAAVRVTEGPAADRGAIAVVIGAWAFAAAAAVAGAALLGWLLSGRIVRPVRALADASDRMAAGDLSARAAIGGDDEIARLGESFNRMADRVSANVSSLRRFVSDAAHQIGTPLTALRTDLELARDDAVTDDARARADRALAQEERLARLSAGLLRLSRLEGAPDVDRGPCRLVPVVLQAVDAVASRAEQRGVEVHVDDGGASCAQLQVPASAALLDDVVGNLLDNAVKFTPPGGEVRVVVDTDGALARVVVTDTGPGIPEEDRELVLERFYRSRSAADVPGSGLGLAIAASSATAVGGSLRVLESPSGARLSFTLPVLRDLLPDGS